MKPYFYLLIIFTFGCHTILKRDELKFIDPIQESIRKAGIDTTFLLIPLDQPLMQKDSAIYSYGIPVDSLNSLYTGGYFVYDKEGRILKDDSSLGGYMHIIYYQYDKDGFVKSKKYVIDYRVEFSAMTQYLEEYKQVSQYWTGISGKMDTTIYLFDDDGLLESESGNFHNDHSPSSYRKIYEYESALPIRITTDYKNVFYGLEQTIEKFEYQETILRKKSKVFRYGQERPKGRPESREEIKYFGISGLIDSLRREDNLKIIFVHK